MKITRENRDSPEVKQYLRELAEESRRQQDPHYLIEQYRHEVETAMAELTAKHDRPQLREAMGMPAGAGIAMDDGRDADDIFQRVGDLNTVTHYAAKVEAAMKARKCKAAIVNAVWLGISAHKAFIAGPKEPDVRLGKQVRGGGAVGQERAYGTAEELRKKYAAWQTKVDAAHKRRPGLTWTALANQIGKKVGTGGRNIRKRCNNPHQNTGN